MDGLDYFDQLSVAFVGRFRNLRSGTLAIRDKFRMGVMTGGCVQRILSGKKYNTECPLLFFNFRNEEYCWNNLSDTPRDSYFMDLSGNRADEIERMIHRDFPSGFLPCRDPSVFQHILDKVHEAFFHPRQQRRYLLSLYVEEFLCAVYTQQTLSGVGNKYERIILSHAEQIRKDPGLFHDIDSFADQLAITKVHYRRLFKSVTGVPPYEYLLQCRLSLAITLLRSSKSLQIQQISQRCGFSSATEFSRFFKKQTSFSPMNYCRIFFE